jgi:predicted DCC family thiol-disulfide oxidoreductase YuxK
MASRELGDRHSGEWVLYDNQCGFCSRWVQFWQPTLAKRNINIAGLQEPWVVERLKLTENDLLHDIRLLSKEDTVVSGADVYLQVAQRIWWAWPFYGVFSVPGFKWILNFSYRWFARNRHRISRTCKLQAADPASPADLPKPER